MCSFNGTRDLASIDSATRIHIYVFDEIHLLTHSGGTLETMHNALTELINPVYFSGFDFQQSVQFETAAIPCGPTHPNVTVSLSLQGRGAVKVDNKYITYSPKVRLIINNIRSTTTRLMMAAASFYLPGPDPPPLD